MTFRPLSAVTTRLTAELYARRIERNAAIEAEVRTIVDDANARLDRLDRRIPNTPTRGRTQMTIEDRLKKIIVEHLGAAPEAVTPEASFIDDLDADSLDTIEIVMAVEEEFGITISDDDAEHILTVGDAVKLIEKAGARQ